MNARKLFHIIVAFMAAMISFYFLMPFNVSSQEGVLNTPQDQAPVVATPSPLTAQADQPIIVDHTSTDITALPQAWIEQAKTDLHIAYGHTSHGSQLTNGMTGLVGFANNGGLGLSHPDDIFVWNNGGTGGALDLHDYAMGGDLGGDWVNQTRTYLGDPNPQGLGSNNPDVNVIIWSWCGQVNDYNPGQEMLDWYLTPMSQLEQEYPGITFVYMTGHAEGTGEGGTVHASNQYIRNYAITNNKVLFDFYDIELYDPNNTYFGDKAVTDNCDYDSDGNGSRDRNWATDWQGAHTQNTDWYSCSCAHSQSLNCNQKAYAAWWLWARLAGWSGIVDENFSINTTGSASTADNGDTITYTVVVRSLIGPSSTAVNLRVELPANLVYVPQTFTATTGTVTDTGPLLWSGVLSPTSVATITYAVTVNTAINTPHIISHTATVSALGSETVTTTTTLMANAEKTYIPIVLK